jgi:hypothetical protein
MKHKDTVIIKHPTRRRIGNVLDATPCSFVCECMLTRGGGGNSLYGSYLGIHVLNGGVAQTARPPKVMACLHIPAKAGAFVFRPVFPHNRMRRKTVSYIHVSPVNLIAMDSS